MEWKPIETLKPEHKRVILRGGVIVTPIRRIDNDVCIAQYLAEGYVSRIDKSGWYFDDSLSRLVIGATHWMPLPCPPAVTEDSNER